MQQRERVEAWHIGKAGLQALEKKAARCPASAFATSFRG